jgi:FkbM family methyltransferase
MQYYSQCNQDRFLEETVFKGFKNGFFFDVGAHDGVSINNTLFFEKNHGWSGVNIEPIADVYNKLIVNRPTSVNLNVAVSNTDGFADFIFNEGYTEMLSGLKQTVDPRHLNRMVRENIQYGGKSKTIQVPTRRIETICKEYNISHIHYLSIDVEGAEFEVIKSINFDTLFIDVIGFENNFKDTSVPITEYLQQKNYKLLKYGTDIFMIHEKSQFINAV